VIAVIGGGISGLAVGYHLLEAGADFVVLEAGSRPGGVVGSIRVEGRIMELGPQRTRLTPPLRRLVGELGLTNHLVTAPDLPLYIYRDGRLRPVPMSLQGALTTDLLGWGDRLRILMEPFTRPLATDETAGAFFARKFGRRTYDRLIAPVYGGLFASDPADMPSRYALAPALAALGVRRSVLTAVVRAARSRGRAPTCSFAGGLQVLTDALARRLGDRLEREAPVRSVERLGGGFRVVHDRGELTADRLVLACPADDAARLLADLDPDSSRRLAGLRYHHLAVVHLVSEADLHGHGYQVALDEGRSTHGVAWPHSMFGRRGLYAAFLGGARRPLDPATPDETLARRAVGDFQHVTGFDARAIHVHRTRMPAWDRTWDRLDGMALDPRIHVCANWRGRPGITGRLAEARRVASRLREQASRDQRAERPGPAVPVAS
jgi:protoporphyrinogen/coproporphyrinogen III oxidase